MKWMKPGRTNKEDRLNFVDFWADYVRTHPDREWSRQQAVLINSQLRSARQLKLVTREMFLRMKGELKR